MRSPVHHGVMLALAGALGLALVSCSPPAEDTSMPTPPPGGMSTDDAAASSQGVTLFANNCAGCHGAEGKGGEGLVGPDLTHAGHEYTADEIKNIIMNGTEKMPAQTSLTEEQVTTVTDHVISFSAAAGDENDMAGEGEMDETGGE